MVAEAPQIDLLKDLLVSRGSPLTAEEILVLLDPKRVDQIAERIHKCTLKTAIEAAKFLKEVDPQGPLLLPAILLMIGRSVPPSEGDQILNKDLKDLRARSYSPSLTHQPFTKQIKRLINQRMAEKSLGS
ncbi:hypothetical protein TWF718_000390 [Orbilia javanica]|uniref:Uncharacterized protein n=1 Tax=Orbilia javanica TaxID=47235 RepID=A0AAN8MTU4_9PEZI